MNPVHDRGSMDPVHVKVVHMDLVQSGGPWTPGPCFVLTPIILVIIYNTEHVQAESKQTLEGETSFLSNRERSRVTSRCHGR